MQITSPYSYQPLPRVTSPSIGRLYQTPNGNLPSVTTILSTTSVTPELDAWREAVGEKKANRVRDEAAGLGTLLHEHLENHILGRARPGGNNIVRILAKNMSDLIISGGLTKITDVWGIEAPLYHPSGYAGTADLIASYNGSMAIIDFKTTKKMKSIDTLGDYPLQLAAYADAHNEMYGTDINSGVIFMVSRDLKFEIFEFSGELFQQSRIKWWERVVRFYELLDDSGSKLAKT